MKEVYNLKNYMKLLSRRDLEEIGCQYWSWKQGNE